MRRLLLAVALVGCDYYDFAGGDSQRDPFFSSEEWALIEQHSPLPAPPVDPTNVYADDPRAALLGQKFYFDRGYAGSRSADLQGGDGWCGDCHFPDAWFGSVTMQPDDERNTPTVVNAVYYTWFLWDGGKDTMWSQSLGPPELQLGSTRMMVVHRIFDAYRAEYNAVFEDLDPAIADTSRFPEYGWPEQLDDPRNGWADMTEADRRIANRIYVNFGKALAAYQRLLVSGNSAFDRYVAGEHDVLAEAEKRGLRLFIGKAGCNRCHTGPAFTDNLFHNIGVPISRRRALGRSDAIRAVLDDEFNVDSEWSDDRNTGRLDTLVAGDPEDEGRFRTKHLRQIGESPRYMHAGQLATLRDVVDFYNDGGGDPFYGELDALMWPLGLTAVEVSELVAFLRTLTGEPIDPDLRLDTSAPK